MGLFRKKPEPINQPLRELAETFADPALADDDPTPGTELLDHFRLDFSVASLVRVDDYLDEIRSRPLEEGEPAYMKVVIRCGAYVGEVVRRNAEGKTWSWLDHEGALKVNKRLAAFGETLGGAAVLWDGKDGLAFPFGKVQKYLDNGREDSVHFFAAALLSQSS